MRLAIIFLLFLFLVPSALAFDCNGILNSKFCKEILDSDLSKGDKDYLLGDIISNEKFFPDHYFVKKWNKKIPTDIAPLGTLRYNQGIVTNAWIKILAVMPSVLENDVLWIDNSGEVLIGVNHQTVKQSNYKASYYPQSRDGYCEIKYSEQENKGQIKLYVNSGYQDSGNSARYSVSGSSATMTASYTVDVIIRAKYYQWKEYRFRGWSWHRCEHHHTNYDTESLTIQDSITAKVSISDSNANFRIKDINDNGIKAKITFSNIVNGELIFNDAYFKQHNYAFSEVVGPLDVLTVKATKLPSEEFHNLIFDGEEVLVKSTSGCRIIVYNFFNSKDISCDLSYTHQPFSVKTNQKVYGENETIQIEINPPGQQYTVNYGNKEYQTTNKLQLKAIYPENKISVRLGEKVVDSYIHVKNDQPLNMAFSLVVFGTVNYALVGLIKKYWGFFL